MRKWTYLVAALLMSGTAATFTSCINTDEPAGIENLRGAKADLLRAKILVEEAEAAIKKAQASYLRAQALYQQEVAAQAKINTEILAAKSAQEKLYWENEKKKLEEKFNKEMLDLKTQTALAQAAYDKAIADIEVAMLNYKENAYAAALYELIYTKSFEYTKYVWDSTEEEYVPSTTPTTALGLKGLADALATAQKDMADALRAKYEAEFNDSKENIIASIKNTINSTKGTIEGYNNTLEQLKLIANTDISEWEKKYNEYKDKVETNNAEKTRLELERDEKTTAIDKQIAELENDFNAKSEIKLEIPEALTEDLYSFIDNALYSLDYSTYPNEYQLQLDAVKVPTDEVGIYKLPTSLSLVMEPTIKTTFLNYLKNNLEWYIFDDNELANEERNLKILEVNKDDAADAYDVAIGDETKGWIKAKNDFIKAADEYKYQYKPTAATNRYDARTILLKEITAYEAKTAPTEADKTDIKTKIKTFLTQRKALDGFVCNLTVSSGVGDAITKIDEADGLDKYLLLSDYAQVGTDALYRNNEGSLYKTYMDATEAIWGSNISTLLGDNYMLEPYTYEDWEKSVNEHYSLFNYYNDLYLYGSSSNSSYGAIIGNGLANDKFVSAYLYENKNLAVTNQADFRTLYASVETINEELLEASIAHQEAKNVLITQRYEITADYAAQTATLDEEIYGLQALMNTMEIVTTSEAPSGSTFDDAIAAIKAQIDGYEGVNGSLVTAQHTLNYYTKLLESVEKGEYEFAQSAIIAEKDALYNARKAESEALQALFDAANEKKNQLLAAIAGE
ncbi:hypothetical protein H6A61_14475 [Bacteroides caecigallinarum]|uniref:hypothetical protein n=1 Tax=Bacteroides caecigallinarum TaxID=1411144 RepID=UPI00195D0250|nr:hypothetical protein [Bacteroides caecigallinarum]MBM6962037.1 hypothetical protein [Bacteroides caecigallinarum]